MKTIQRLNDKWNNLAGVMQTAIGSVWRNDAGQDLIEYALVVALVAFAATAGMNTLATGINGAFSNIAQTLNTQIT